MTTNGTLLGKKDAGRLKRLKLHSITISLDGLEGTHERPRNVSGCFQKTVDAVRDMQSAGIYVGSILCNGGIYSCLDIERRVELVQGNILANRFSTVWFEKFEEFRSDRAEYSSRCPKCAERKFCGGDSMHTWDFEKKEPIYCPKCGGYASYEGYAPHGGYVPSEWKLFK